MKQMTLKQAREAFDDVFDAAQSEPVLITRDGKPARVLLSMEDMEALEDHFLGKAAMQAHAGGYIDKEASAALMRKFMNAGD